jgi:hypothetical protein
MVDDFLICVQCDSSFEMTSKEYNNHIQRGFDPPMRCPACRKNKHKQVNGIDLKHLRHKSDRQKELQEEKIPRGRKNHPKSRSSKRVDW